MSDDFAFKAPTPYRKPDYYHIIDRHTGSIVGKAKTLKAASRSIDRRDNAYGAYRYGHRGVYEDSGDQGGKT